MYEQPFNPFAKNLSIVKDYFRSGGVLALAIIRAVTTVMTVVASAVSAKYIYAFTINVLRRYDAPYDVINTVHEQMSSSTASTVASIVPSALIGILIAVAFFIIYFKSRDDSPEASPKSGFGILYVIGVLNVIGAILVSLLLALCIVAVIILAVEFSKYLNGAYGAYNDLSLPFDIDGYYSMSSGAATVLAVVLAIVFAVTAFIVLFYYINQLRYYSSLKNSISSVELLSKGARPYGVMNIIFAVISALNLLSLPALYSSIDMLGIDSSSMVIVGVLLAVLQIASVASMFLEGRIAIGYAKQIDKVKFGYNTHAPAAGPYSPFVAGSSANDYQNAAYADQMGGYREPSGFNGAPYYANPPQTPPAGSANHAQPSGNSYADDYESVASPKAQAPASTICPACGAPAEPGAPFCGNCGTRLF